MCSCLGLNEPVLPGGAGESRDKPESKRPGHTVIMVDEGESNIMEQRGRGSFDQESSIPTDPQVSWCKSALSIISITL